MRIHYTVISKTCHASVSYDVPEQDGSKTMKEIYQEYLKQADIDQKEARG